MRPWRNIRKSPFARSVGGMMAYTAIGQSVYLLTGPFIGRIYSPYEFGLYGLFFTFAVTAVGIIFLNYDFAIPAASSDDDARALTRGAFTLALALTPLAGMVMAAMILFQVAAFGGLPLTAPLMLMALLSSQGLVQLLQNWSIRRHETVVIGKASVTMNVVRGATQIALGALLPSWWILAAGEVLGRIGNAFHLARISPAPGSDIAPRGLQQEAVPNALRRYRQFPLVLLPSQVIDGSVAFIQSAGLAYLFGASGLGLFFMMRRTLDLPVAFAFRSLSDVFYAKLAQDARQAPERVRPFFVRSVLLIMGFGFAGGIPAMFASPTLFAFIFGAEWREAGVLAAIMAPASIMNLAVAPVARVFALTTRPYLRYWFTGINLLGTIAALVAAWAWPLNLTWTTACLSAVTFTAYVAYFAAGYVASAALIGQEPGTVRSIP
ncbi:hypothetical protein LZK98_15400 [Sphingomonas cannabina]|uniref:lipopolysaccharide biosynthesis protein n=1 Tax=Sphingomonas cannabina TaxID=2899123 RepID=UPI001F4488AC|nr:hypothetical protein [Sphingomonas cannabina]UIJ44439.1 hypothetical protein LZK98_15400 [Sphingomonas cannabina]